MRRMAMATYVQMVTDEEIAALRADPASIHGLDKPEDQSFRTYYACCISYFLTGDPYPSRSPLAPMLSGAESVETSTLENGSFGVVPAKTAAAVARELAKVDMKKLRARIAKADLSELVDEEVDDAEVLSEAEDPVAELMQDVEELASFYARAAEMKLGVAMYTT